jgi:hypothetical protein
MSEFGTNRQYVFKDPQRTSCPSRIYDALTRSADSWSWSWQSPFWCSAWRRLKNSHPIKSHVCERTMFLSSVDFLLFFSIFFVYPSILFGGWLGRQPPTTFGVILLGWTVLVHEYCSSFQEKRPFLSLTTFLARSHLQILSFSFCLPSLFVDRCVFETFL